eukprot:Sdes_comp21483_c0_seq1m20107
MTNNFEPIVGARLWAMSNPCMLACMTLYSSLEIFAMTSMEKLRRKSLLLTGYLELLLQPLEGKLTIITPRNPMERGSQLSLLFKCPLRPVFQYLQKNGVISDMREPNVLRICPAPMYNTYYDVWKFVSILTNYFSSKNSLP